MVAPCVRLQISKEQLKALEESLKVEKPVDGLYLKELKNGNHKPKTSGKTWPLDDKEDERDDVIAVGEFEDSYLKIQSLFISPSLNWISVNQIEIGVNRPKVA